MIRIKYFLFVLLSLSLVACQLILPVRFINHEKPNLTVDDSPFSKEGCTQDQYGWYECNETAPLYKLGCAKFRADPLLGGLQPEYPVVNCLFTFSVYEEPWPVQDSECFYIDGGFIQSCSRLVIFKDGKHQLIHNAEELRSIYAPVTSQEEALGFAWIAQIADTYYGLTYNANYIYEVKTMEDTYVESVDDDYIVHLFDYELFGCGPHYTYAVAVLVTSDGNVYEISREPVYRDPSEDDLCVD